MITTLKKMYINETKADGSAYVDKNGRPYKRVTLEIPQGKYSKIFYNDDMIPHWKPGDQIGVELTQNGSFKNWDFPKAPDGNPYAAQPNNPITTNQGTAFNPSQKHNPVDIPFPTEQVVDGAREVFHEPIQESDPIQERIIRGMCFNNASTILAGKEMPIPPQEVKDLTLSLYQEMAEWLRNQ